MDKGFWPVVLCANPACPAGSFDLPEQRGSGSTIVFRTEPGAPPLM